jgi:UDP-N-acetyl-D-glucosamine/UDP-N-acetyl-D-galactosamine dehydrogenase
MHETRTPSSAGDVSPRGSAPARTLSVVGLGYVGLPVAAAFANAGLSVVGFDIDPVRIAELKTGVDRTGEVDASEIGTARLTLTAEADDLSVADFHIITVPTPITPSRQPDFGPLIAASHTIGSRLKRGDIVVYESTVHPGATEEICIPILEDRSGLRLGTDFAVGYSPERINPGDREHRFETIVKVVAASDPETLDIVAAVYGTVVRAGIHRAPSIRVAEAAKIIENTQRDLNIALMNELALICDRMGIRTADVLRAASTKWNFLPFAPGLVGGHCISVDPYYLTAKAEALGYRPEVILAGRRINDGMGRYVAQRVIRLLIRGGLPVQQARVGIIGLTFKENVPDLRNSRVPDIIEELAGYGVVPLVHDPIVDAQEALRTYGIALDALDAFVDLDALVVAVPHAALVARGPSAVAAMVRPGGAILDVKSAYGGAGDFVGYGYWSL